MYFTQHHLKVFHQLLSAVGYPGLESLEDEECVKSLFLNIDEKETQDLFVWIVKQFHADLEQYAISQDKLRWLLVKTGLILLEIQCTNFLTGLLPNEEQLKIWKTILAVVYYKKDKDVKPENNSSDHPLSTPETSPKTTKSLNLLPAEYQAEFEEQTKGNYKEYINKMKEKLLKKEQDDRNISNAEGRRSNASLEETIDKVLNFKPTKSTINSSNPKEIDLDIIHEFANNYESLVKPVIGLVLDQATVPSDTVPHLEHFGEFLQEYSSMSQMLEVLSQFAEYRGDLSGSCQDRSAKPIPI
uniref:Uncharacterized protein n=1 Tax=Cacopsylla melanoneura TaxID=428564 RepID=A0A8D8SG62_9HEMI